MQQTSDTLSQLSLLGNLFTGCGTMIFALAAVFAINQWLAETRYKTRQDLARHIGILALKFRDKFWDARNPAFFEYEYLGRESSQDETQEEKYWQDQLYAHNKRLEPLGLLLNELKEVNWEYEILLDESYAEAIQKYRDAYNELLRALIQYHSKAFRQALESGSEHHVERAEKLEQVIFRTSDDPLDKSVDDATEEITNGLKKHFRKSQESEMS